MTLSAYTYKLLDEFEEAIRNHVFKGSHHPADWEDDEKWYREAKKKLLKHLHKHYKGKVRRSKGDK